MSSLSLEIELNKHTTKRYNEHQDWTIILGSHKECSVLGGNKIIFYIINGYVPIDNLYI